jgi:hypothetical protein
MWWQVRVDVIVAEGQGELHIVVCSWHSNCFDIYIYADSMSYNMVLGLYIHNKLNCMQHSDFFDGKFLLFPEFFLRKNLEKQVSFLTSVKCAISVKKLSLSKNQKNWPKQNIGICICMCQRWWHAIRICMARDCRCLLDFADVL